ncbi:MAG: 3D domain-containing protein [Lacrimispora sp.]|uniref:3D domain-containing protein n=1 Tax=Lacrimispora sp. TaxID=2719234 RepID=UPI0039E6B054
MTQTAKRIHWLSGALLMTAFLWISALNIFAAQASGIIDYADENGVRGWAYNSAQADQPLEVKVVITNQANGQVAAELTAQASIYREDLAAQGLGSGNCGFDISVPWESYGEGTFLVETYAGGQRFSSKLYGKGLPASSQLRSLGVFKTTAYCPCRQCSGGWGGRTSTGTIAKANHTISVDPRVIPYGTRVMVNGIIYTAEDRGSGVKGNHIDIFFNTHGESRTYGLRNVEAFLVQ